jgi:hypothetical protein
MVGYVDVHMQLSDYFTGSGDDDILVWPTAVISLKKLERRDSRQLSNTGSINIEVIEIDYTEYYMCRKISILEVCISEVWLI